MRAGWRKSFSDIWRNSLHPQITMKVNPGRNVLGGILGGRKSILIFHFSSTRKWKLNCFPWQALHIYHSARQESWDEIWSDVFKWNWFLDAFYFIFVKCAVCLSTEKLVWQCYGENVSRKRYNSRFPEIRVQRREKNKKKSILRSHLEASYFSFHRQD